MAQRMCIREASEALVMLIFLGLMQSSGVLGQLRPNFYISTCPNVSAIVHSVVQCAVQQEPRMAASLLRLHFHDCFVNGCDGSVLLDDTPTFTGEKNAIPNANSLRGFEVIDTIKNALENACPRTVSCADLLAIAARDSVVLTGGPTWNVQLGRRDSTSASQEAANERLPSPTDSLAMIKAKFQAVGLQVADIPVLSGAHTIGRARCSSFIGRLYNFNNSGAADPTLDTSYKYGLAWLCPEAGGEDSMQKLTALDTYTPDVFDSAYFAALQGGKGLLQSDQELLSTPAANTANFVNGFAADQSLFFAFFAASMIRMGNISPLLATDQGNIRTNCRLPNPSP